MTKLTKKDYFKMVASVIENSNVENKTELQSFISHEIELLEKKAQSRGTDNAKTRENNEIVEIWEANLAEPVGEGTNKFKGTYYQGYLSEFTKTSSSEEHVECETTFKINGSGADGDVTVSVEQQEIAAYVFADTQKTGA